ncbi:MAG: N-acetyltransferase [Eubacteriaceae bacterium]|nr:N-acetyltransferase [Eubacteriaceae bacterium]
MDCKIVHEEKKTRFVIKDAGNEAAPNLGKLIYYFENGDILVIDHTEVDPSLKGMGMGSKLVDSFMDYSRKIGCKVDSECDFANSVIDNYMDKYKDLLVEGRGYRAQSQL